MKNTIGSNFLSWTRRLAPASLLLAGVLSYGTAAADSREAITVQGRLTNSTGAPIINGESPLCFRLCNSQNDLCTEDAKLFEEAKSVIVNNGVYSASLGTGSHSGSLDALLTNTNAYLEIATGTDLGTVCASGTNLSPRVPFNSAPFAYRARTADTTKSYDSTANLSAVDGTFTGNVGIGTTGSTKNLDVTGTISEGGTSLGSKYVPLAGGVNVTGGLNIAGNVGIGTTTPTAKLETYTTGLAALFGTGTNADTYMGFRRTTNGAYFGYSSGDTALLLQGGIAKGISFRVNSDTFSSGTQAMFINSDGLVGIGTAGPTRKLQVVSATDNIIQSQSTGVDSNAYYTLVNDASQWSIRLMGSNSDALELRNDSTGIPGLVIQTGGSVGIGTNSPSLLLDLEKNQNNPTGIELTNTGTGSGAIAIVKMITEGGYAQIYRTNNSHAVPDSLIIQDLGGGDVAFYGAAESVRIKNNGNVGIGTTNPAAKLHIDRVSGSGLLDTLFLSGGDGANGDGARIVFNTLYATYPTWRMAEIGSIYTNYGVDSGSALVFRTNSGPMTTVTEAMRITSDGNVGIGIADPGSYKLHVEGSMIAQSYTTGDIMFRATDNGPDVWRMFEDEHSLYTESLTTGHTALTIKDTGSVGIGTTNPDPKSKLDVNGQIKIGDGDSDCNSTSAGVIRYNGDNFYGCTSTGWKKLDN